MSRCAGVQNVSRPMDICQEISQYPPMTTETTAAKSDQTYQGTAVNSPDGRVGTGGEAWATDASVEATSKPKSKVAHRRQKIELQAESRERAEQILRRCSKLVASRRAARGIAWICQARGTLFAQNSPCRHHGC